jgi:hypothetical protein
VTGTVESGRTATGRRAWWRWWRLATAVVLALVIAAVAFAYRFNTLGGALGGFDDDHFAHLMRTEMLLRGEQPLRDFSESELRGAWPSLSYELPAIAQRLGGRNLLSEAYLTTAALAVAHATLFLLALELSKRWSVALLATALAIATAPKLYNYHKVLMLALVALAIRGAVANPTVPRLACAAVVTAVAALFRHDYGVYVVVGMVAGLVLRDVANWSLMARRVGTYLGLSALCALPSAIWVQVYEGIPAFVMNALTSSQLETGRTPLPWPHVSFATPLEYDSLVAVAYYAFYALLIVAAVAWIWRALVTSSRRLDALERGVVAGLIALSAIVSVFFLRANVGQRIGDAVLPVALLGAWSASAFSIVSNRSWRVAAMFVPAALLGTMLWAAWGYTEAARELDTGGLSDSWAKTARRFNEVRADLRRLPPDVWTDADATGTLRAARYVAECTDPGDYLLVAGYSPEIPVFARRRFAAGQGTVSLSFYTSERDQQRAIAYWQKQSVPIVLADYDEYEEGFVTDYPRLHDYLTQHYREAGSITVDNEPRFRVFVETARPPIRTDPHLGLPCFR